LSSSLCLDQSAQQLEYVAIQGLFLPVGTSFFLLAYLLSFVCDVQTWNKPSLTTRLSSKWRPKPSLCFRFSYLFFLTVLTLFLSFLFFSSEPSFLNHVSFILFFALSFFFSFFFVKCRSFVRLTLFALVWIWDFRKESQVRSFSSPCFCTFSILFVLCDSL
jgi:hypothetical protein